MPPQQPIKPGQDVTALMPGQDVTDLMGGTTPPPKQELGNPIIRALGGVITGSGLNPVEMGKGMVQAATNPVQTVTSLVAPLGRLPGAWEAFKQGRYTDAANEAAASIPILGPAAEHASERMKSGDIAGGAGEVVGMPIGLVLGMGKPKPSSGNLTATLGEMAERNSANKMVRTIAPTKGKAAVNFGNMAADVAPQLAREPGMNAGSFAGLRDKVGAKLATAELGLDAAADARFAGHAFETAPILADLKAARQKLVAETVEGSQPTRQTVDRISSLVDEGGKPIVLQESKAVPLGKDVVTQVNKHQVEYLDKAIAEIEDLGPVARYESLRKIRQSYDGPAKATYNPSVTADYGVKMGEKYAAAAVTRSLRDKLAQFDPNTAAANKPYSFWQKVDDVMQAAEETERTKPRVMRSVMGRGTGAVSGAIVGTALGSPTIGAVAGYFMAEAAEKLAQSGATTKIAGSRAMAILADALRSGDAVAAQSQLTQIAKYTGLTARLNALIAQQQEGK